MSKDIFDSIERGLKEAIAHTEGKRAAVQLHSVELPDVAAIRKSLGMTQARFASAFRVSIGTLRNWEQGRRTPEGPALALITAIRNRPKEVLEALNA